MDVLKDERKRGFAAVRALDSFAHCTSWRIEEKCAVIRLAVVVAGRAESKRPGQNQECRRKRPPVMRGVDQGRIERREIRSPLVEFSLEGSKRRVDAEHTEHDDHGQDFDPPQIVALCGTEAAYAGCRRGSRHGCTVLWGIE